MTKRMLISALFSVGFFSLVGCGPQCHDSASYPIDTVCGRDGGLIARAYVGKSTTAGPTCTTNWDGGRDISFSFAGSLCESFAFMNEVPQEVASCDLSSLPDGTYTINGGKPVTVARPADGGAPTCQ